MSKFRHAGAIAGRSIRPGAFISQPPGKRGESEKMNKYECFKIGDYNTRLILTTEKEYKPGDVYADEYKDETHHFIYGKYIVMEKY